MKNRLTMEKFERWLNRFEDNDVVGTAGELCGCPLARCLKALNPYYTFYVSNEAIDVLEPPRRYVTTQPADVLHLKPWQIELIRQVDSTGSSNVTAGTVRAILREIWGE